MHHVVRAEMEPERDPKHTSPKTAFPPNSHVRAVVSEGRCESSRYVMSALSRLIKQRGLAQVMGADWVWVVRVCTSANPQLALAITEYLRSLAIRRGGLVLGQDQRAAVVLAYFQASRPDAARVSSDWPVAGLCLALTASDWLRLAAARPYRQLRLQQRCAVPQRNPAQPRRHKPLPLS